MSIIGKLFGLKKAADYASAVEGLQQERTAAEERLEQLKVQRSKAPFEGADVSLIQTQIRDTETEIETLQGVIAEATERMRHAEKVETEAQLRDSIAVARKDRAALRLASKKFDTALAEVEQQLEAMERLDAGIAEANRQADAAGFPDLRLRAPKLPHATFPSPLRRDSIKNLRGVSITPAFEDMAANGRLD